ncbi:MAG: alpha-E domain-containing protein [Chromatiales bacterium]|jgi:uncharacterized alpha-E superfamily protein
MLSRVAERLYWTARYLERTENMARLINAYFQMVLDMPRGEEPGWGILLDITSSREIYLRKHETVNEIDVINFFIVDEGYPGSIISSVMSARENVRTTRDIITPGLWEELNELNLYVHELAEKSLARRFRYEFLEQIVQRCQQITGLVENVMCRTQAYRFIQLGRNLERADMTSRILDVGATAVNRRREQEGRDSSQLRYDSLLWMHILLSLNALTMYRQRIGPRVSSKGVVHFLLQDITFPRSVIFCVHQIGEAFTKLPRRGRALNLFAELQDKLYHSDADVLAETCLHEFVDEIQRDLIRINDIILSTWCSLEQKPVQTQSQ